MVFYISAKIALREQAKSENPRNLCSAKIVQGDTKIGAPSVKILPDKIEQNRLHHLVENSILRRMVYVSSNNS
jgi:hypothetical protein